jgi:hypothetical protein
MNGSPTQVERQALCLTDGITLNEQPARWASVEDTP